jgi:large subunit ribosomal protein L25
MPPQYRRVRSVRPCQTSGVSDHPETGFPRATIAAVAGERVKLTASERTDLGSAESRRLRKQGLIPGVLYGRSKPVAIAVAERDLRTALTGRAGMHAVLDVTVDGRGSHSAILKEFQVSKVRGKLTHVDLQEVRLDQPIQTAVSVHLIGEPVGVKEGGVLSQVTTEVHIEALPLEIPEHLDIDVSEMQIGDTLRLSALDVPDNVTLLDDPEETVLASVAMARVEIEPEAEAEGLEEGEEAAEEGEPSEPEAAEEGDSGSTEG